MSKPTKNAINTPQTLQTLDVTPYTIFWDGLDYIIKNLKKNLDFIIQTIVYCVKI